MILAEALTEFFGVPPIRAAVESELPNDDLVVIINGTGKRKLLTRCGLCQRNVTVTAVFRIRTMTEVEITEMLYLAFYRYNTAGRWLWKEVEVSHGSDSLKTGNPKMVPFEISFDFYSTP